MALPRAAAGLHQTRQKKWLPEANWVGTVHNGTAIDHFRLRETPGDYLVFLRRISPEKRLDRAIEIVRDVGMKLVVAAKVDSVDQAYYETAIALLIRANRGLIEYIGDGGEHEKDEVLGNAYAYVFPSVRICLSNFSGRTLPLTVSLEVGGDFRDLFDIRGFPRRLRGGIYLPPIWQDHNLTLGFTDRQGAMAGSLVHFSQLPSLTVASTKNEPEAEPIAMLPGFDHLLGVEAQTLLPPPRDTVYLPVSLAAGAS